MRMLISQYITHIWINTYFFITLYSLIVIVYFLDIFISYYNYNYNFKLIMYDCLSPQNLVI